MTNSIWVKVCGLTRAADVEAALTAGADAVGLVLVARSPRCLDAARAAELAAMAAGRAEVVLLVEGSPTTALAAAVEVGADSLQPYGSNVPAVAAAALQSGLGVLLPVPVGGGPVDVSAVPQGARPLLDTASAGGSGGSGKPFDWRLARGVDAAVIAGGLDGGNVADAIAAARPWGVDASSRLEAAVGVKDHSKVAAFVEAAKAAEEQSCR